MGVSLAVQRSSLNIMLSVWKALFLREAVHRLFGSRAAWLWLLLEPIVHVLFFTFVFTIVRLRLIGGIDTVVWLTAGLLPFFMFRRTGTQSMNAIGPNRSLFAYRQVQPVDAVLTRAGLEGFLMLMAVLILMAGAGLAGLDVLPADPLAVLGVLCALWVLGLGFGLITSVARELVPEFGSVIGLLMMPLYFISGTMFPIASLPQPYRDWLLLNPIAHALEAARYGFSPYYQPVPELSVGYLYGSALISIFLGLTLQVRFARRLVAA